MKGNESSHSNGKIRRIRPADFFVPICHPRSEASGIHNFSLMLENGDVLVFGRATEQIEVSRFCRIQFEASCCGSNGARNGARVFFTGNKEYSDCTLVVPENFFGGSKRVASHFVFVRDLEITFG